MLRQCDLLKGVTDEEFSVVRCQTRGLLYLNNSRPGRRKSDGITPICIQYYHNLAARLKQRTSLERKAKEFSAMIKRWRAGRTITDTRRQHVAVSGVPFERSFCGREKRTAPSLSGYAPHSLEGNMS